jgi:CheY-like chemotaxis protein
MTPYNLSILIVDDNPSFVKSFEMLLRSVLGSKIVTLEVAYNGLEAIDRVKKMNGFDYIFMDVNMPELNGIEASRLIDMEYFRRTKIIAISFNDDFKTISDMMHSGATNYINKSKITFDVISKIFNDNKHL